MIGVRPHLFVMKTVDAVVDDMHVAAAELTPDQSRVVLTHGHHFSRPGKRAALEPLEFPPLLLDVPALQKVAFGLVVALPDQRFHVVSDQDLGADFAASHAASSSTVASTCQTSTR